jgi:hypothetical protein
VLATSVLPALTVPAVPAVPAVATMGADLSPIGTPAPMSQQVPPLAAAPAAPLAVAARPIPSPPTDHFGLDPAPAAAHRPDGHQGETRIEAPVTVALTINGLADVELVKRETETAVRLALAEWERNRRADAQAMLYD